MEKPKKQIMYRPPTGLKSSETEEVISKVNKIQKLPERQSTEIKKYDGKKIADWIKKATLLNLSGLCKEAKIDRANLDKYLTKGIIPDQHIEALTAIIKKYGYAE